MKPDLTLIRTKLNRPQVASDLVERPRLVDKLNQGVGQKLTLVSAPAGYGKSTLVVRWLEQVGQPAAWISLDENDNDLLLFIRYVIAALRRHYPEACNRTAQFLEVSQPPPPMYLATRLINDVSKLPGNLILALDDYHLIHDEQIHELIVALIDNQPSNLHLLIASRADPQLPLPRMRAAGNLTEIRQIDLRFSPAEAISFLLHSAGNGIDAEFAAALNERTEGWIVGLRLAALSIQGYHNQSDILQSFQDGPSTFVSEYLVEEVLAQQSEAIQAFMLRVAILDRLNGPLCDAVAGIDDPECNGQAYLEWLQRANLL